MQLALDSQNRRVLAAIGQEAICPCCYSSVKGYSEKAQLVRYELVGLLIIFVYHPE